MGEKNFRIESTPEETSGMHTTQGVPRSEANVEAEKGETMVTSDGVSNQNKLVAIGGEKHSSGGTPLDVPDGTIIYSDKLKIKDPLLLKFFNESGKKEKTFADISKKYDITKWQKELEDEDNDRITETSLEKNLDDGNFKLSALFAIQEFHEEKGSPDEHSKHFEPFMERMGINYDQLFGTAEVSPADSEPLLARNGTEVSFDKLPMMHKGGEGTGIPSHAHGPGGSHGHGKSEPYGPREAYKREGAMHLNGILEKLDLESIAEKDYNNRKVIEAKVVEAQAKGATMPNLIDDYMMNWTGEDKSHRPNNLMQDALLKKGLKPKDPKAGFTNQELQDLRKNGVIDQEFVVKMFQDGLWHYRMPWSHITDINEKDKYDALQTEIKSRGVEGSDGNFYLWKGEGEYEAYRYNPDGSIERVQPDPKVIDKEFQWDVKHIDERPKERNMDFRWDHKRALAQARKNKTNIPRISPFTPIEDTTYADQIYYSPDQAIASMQSMVSDAGTKQAMFAPQQQQVANFLAGQQFDLMGKIVGQYEDKNVAAYNQESLINTNIANRASERLSRAIEGHHDKTTILQQEYANARTNADNNIAENEIAMWNERRNRMNLEATIGEQFATDPNTGLHEFQYGKDYYPTNNAADDIAATWSDLRRKLPEATDKDITDMAMAYHSGKYEARKGSRDETEPNPANYR